MKNALPMSPTYASAVHEYKLPNGIEVVDKSGLVVELDSVSVGFKIATTDTSVVNHCLGWVADVGLTD